MLVSKNVLHYGTEEVVADLISKMPSNSSSVKHNRELARELSLYSSTVDYEAKFLFAPFFVLGYGSKVIALLLQSNKHQRPLI